MEVEVEVEGRVVSRKGKLTAVMVEVRKEEYGELFAIGRQWVTPTWPTMANKTSKL
jgi:acyl-coenzyme A thioesterase 13